MSRSPLGTGERNHVLRVKVCLDAFIYCTHFVWYKTLSPDHLQKPRTTLKYQLQWPRIQEEGSTAGRGLLHHEEASTDQR